LKFSCSAIGQETMFDQGQTPPGALVSKESTNSIFNQFTYMQNNMTLGYRSIDNAEISSAVQTGIQQALLGIDIDTVLKEIEAVSQSVNQ
ncbi:MAG: hypothetical protein K8S14_07195, partial [Actinomycetia bacterium]|nr:hypothetical protein [Actinomycetes bacterium]